VSDWWQLFVGLEALIDQRHIRGALRIALGIA
jgi:hypothetical protein